MRIVKMFAAVVGLTAAVGGVSGAVRGDASNAAVVHDLRTGDTRVLGVAVATRDPSAQLLIAPKSAPATDDRSVIQPTTTSPWRTACKVTSIFPGSVDPRVGSAVMIGPHHALTAGRVVRDKSLGGWATTVVVTPAFDGTNAPYGTAHVVQTRSFSGWIDDENPDHDIALLVLDKDLGYDSGWLDTWGAPDEALAGAVAHSAGYPVDKFQQSGIDRLWGWTGVIGGFAPNRISYGGVFDAGGGQDGSAIWLDYTAVTGRILIVGVHDDARPGVPASGARIDAVKFPWIDAWTGDFDGPAQLRIAWVTSTLNGVVGPSSTGVIRISLANAGDAPADATVELVWKDASGASEPMTSRTLTLGKQTSMMVDLEASIPSDAAAGKGHVEATINALQTVPESDYSDDVSSGPEWTVVKDWRTLGLGAKTRDVLAPAAVALYQFPLHLARRALTFRLSGKRGSVLVRRPDGTTFSVDAGKAWSEKSPQQGTWAVAITNYGSKPRVFRLSAKPSKK